MFQIHGIFTPCEIPIKQATNFTELFSRLNWSLIWFGFCISHLLLQCAKMDRLYSITDGKNLFWNSYAVRFNRALDVCKLTGAVLFCVGGTSMAVGLLLSAFAKSYSKDELYLQHKFKERLANLHATVGKLAHMMKVLMNMTFFKSLNMNKTTACVTGSSIMKAPTPGEGKVPVTLSKVQNIQPVATKAETWSAPQ